MAQGNPTVFQLKSHTPFMYCHQHVLLDFKEHFKFLSHLKKKGLNQFVT